MGEVSGTCDVLHHDLDFGNRQNFFEEYSAGEEDYEEDEDEVDENGDWVGVREPWLFENDMPPIPYRYFQYQYLMEAFEDHNPPSSISFLPSDLLENKMGWLPGPRGHQLTAEEAERNARELLAEEERVKKKAEKKRLKKKKQKDRKKREKLEQERKNAREAELSTPAAGAEPPQTSSAEKGKESSGSSSSSGPRGSLGKEEGSQRTRAEELEDELDLSCSFVSKAREKAGIRLPVPSKEKPDSTEPGRKAPGKAPQPVGACPAAPQVPKPKPPDPSVVEQSLVVAGRGNEAAQQGRYAEAVQAFTKAIRLNPQEHRLFGNRSYCYEKLQHYKEALKDAQESLRLQPGWPKGFFRKAKALQGLQRYAEAVHTFEKLLRQDGANAEVATQLEACRALLLKGSHQSSPGGIPMSLSPLEATEPPLSPSGEGAIRSCQKMDESTFVTIVSSKNRARGQGQPAARSPSNTSNTSNFPTLPRGHPARDCYPLWVGNITPRISQQILQQAFGRFGEINSIRMLSERRCAFINYTRKKAAEAAYTAMKETELEGSRLVLQLKHPSHATPSPWQHPGRPQ